MTIRAMMTSTVQAYSNVNVNVNVNVNEHELLSYLIPLS